MLELELIDGDLLGLPIQLLGTAPASTTHLNYLSIRDVVIR